MIQWGRGVTRQPISVVVDFFNAGSAIEAIDTLNNVKGPIGHEGMTRDVMKGVRR
jgi:hypothetical protein